LSALANQLHGLNLNFSLILRFTLSHHDDRMSGWIWNFTVGTSPTEEDYTGRTAPCWPRCSHLAVKLSNFGL
jgi:hypothetical protein